MESAMPSPTGSGHISFSAFGPFLEAVTAAVLLHRDARALKYRLQRQEREYKIISGDLDDLRVDQALLDRVHGQSEEERARMRANAARMEVLHPQFRDRTMALEQLREQYRLAKEKLPQAANEVYALETPVVNDAFRPDPPDAPALPPRLYYALHKAKVGARLLEEDRKEAQTSGNQVNWSYGRLDDAAAEVLRHIGYAQQRGLTHSTGLADSMALLRRRIDVHQVVLQNRGEARAKVEKREFEQHMQEDEMFLDVVAPVLEAENRIEQDLLRTSVFDRDDHGERLVYQNIPRHRLTDAQTEDDLAYFAAFKEEIQHREDVLEHVADTKRQKWQASRAQHPDETFGPSDERLDEDRIVAEEMVTDAHNYAHQLSRLSPLLTASIRATTGTGSTSAWRPARILSRFDGKAVNEWFDGIAGGAGNTETREGTPDSWTWRSVDVHEQRDWDVHFLPEEEEWLHAQLLERYKVISDETRRGMSMLDHMRESVAVERDSRSGVRKALLMSSSVGFGLTLYAYGLWSLAFRAGRLAPTDIPDDAHET
ncbi:hypothetical protein LTR53_000806 [Teratosphaeriaceae sp. CCFEE 6253]|nr:hypothetical protein LTR53_000806 [Teratosphaeriaceae sp. CCFEE 6253]